VHVLLCQLAWKIIRVFCLGPKTKELLKLFFVLSSKVQKNVNANKFDFKLRNSTKIINKFCRRPRTSIGRFSCYI